MSVTEVGEVDAVLAADVGLGVTVGDWAAVTTGAGELVGLSVGATVGIWVGVGTEVDVGGSGVSVGSTGGTPTIAGVDAGD